MFPHRRRSVRSLFALLAAASTAMVLAGPQSASADVNPSADHLVVWDDNIENMLPESCADGYLFDRLLAYIGKQAQSPDIFAVQQISNQEQLSALTKRLTDELPGTYAGQIAIAEPGSMGYTSTCGKMKNQQTNAVIYRTDRLTYQQITRWRSDAPADYDAGTGGCQNLTPTRSSQDRVENVAIRLHDTVANKDVSVASVHWPTSTWYGPECAAENMNEAQEAMGRLGGDLQIVTGDMNTTTGTKSWWQNAMDAGYRDPMAEKCGGRVCSADYNTTENHRFDFLLVTRGHGFSNVATVTDAMAGGPYSNHRALTAYVKY